MLPKVYDIFEKKQALTQEKDVGDEKSSGLCPAQTGPLTRLFIKHKITNEMVKKLSLFSLLLVLCATAISAMGESPKKETPYMIEQKGNLIIKSSAFKNQEYIPDKYAFKGANVNPPLAFENVPAAAKSFVLICDDPDAPMGTWDHWIVFNIPPQVRQIRENEVPKGARLGTNSFKRLEYGGPAPPPGPPHHYVFKLYALNTVLNLKEGAEKEEVVKAMEGHVLAQTSLVGLYKR